MIRILIFQIYRYKNNRNRKRFWIKSSQNAKKGGENFRWRYRKYGEAAKKPAVKNELGLKKHSKEIEYD